MYNQKDKVIVKFPFTDGTEFKKRPALVISNDAINKKGDYLIVQITSKLHDDGLSISILDKNCLVPLPLKSYFRTHKIFTVHHSLILSKITEIKPFFFNSVMKNICKLIK